MHMGDENGAQVAHRQWGVQQLVLRAFAAIDQVPAFAGGLDHGRGADIAGLGGHPGGGAQKLQVHCRILYG
ncbi:hypothetical protein D3C76_1747690 [compost metagenome]